MPRFFAAFAALIFLALAEVFADSLPEPSGLTTPALLGLGTVLVPGWIIAGMLRRPATSEEGLTRVRAAQVDSLASSIPLAGFVAILYARGDAAVEAAIPPHLPGLATLLLFLPLVAGWCHTLGRKVAAENRRDGIPESTARGVLRELRPVLLVFAVYTLVQAVRDLGIAVPEPGEWVFTRPWLAAGSSLFTVGLVVVLSPFAVRTLHPARPLPDGPLRERLDEIARGSGTTVQNVYLWDTGPRPALNACVAGVLPWNRSVFITDGLLEVLGPDEVEAVFAHELAHGRHHHLWLFIGLVFGFAGIAMAGPRWIGSVAGGTLSPFDMEIFVLLIVGVGFYQFFGRLSRHLENQADLYSADHTGSPFGIVSALQRIGILTGAIHRKRGWRHPPISHRVATVLGLWSDPLRRARFSHRTKRLLLVWAAILALGGFGWSGELRGKLNAPEWEQTVDHAAHLLEGHSERTRRPWSNPEREERELRRSTELLIGALSGMPGSPERRGDRQRAYHLLAYAYEQLEEPWNAAVARYLAGGSAPNLGGSGRTDSGEASGSPPPTER